MTEPRGALFFWPDEPHITGYLVIGKDNYELVGVRASHIRTDFKGRKIETKQVDMFDERSGEGDSKRDQL
jgi:hypothetical protein